MFPRRIASASCGWSRTWRRNGPGGIHARGRISAGPENHVPAFGKHRAKEEDVDAFVVGLPIPDAHQTTDQLEKTKQFVRDLQAISEKEVYVVDEQFSSAEARRLQHEYGSDMPEDALAATIILQAFLDGDRDLTIETAAQREE